MSLIKDKLVVPSPAKLAGVPKNFQADVPSDVLTQWADMPMLADSTDQNTITIFDVIGEDMWTGAGFTAKRAAAALRNIGNNPVTVQVNSPGGDMFEGIAIYNLLRQHPAKVTVQVVGWAASAASIIAMAADEIVMGVGSMMMVHNAWGAVVGNRHDFAAASATFEQFDSAIADIYEARTGRSRKDIVAMMDAETFMGAQAAVDEGFADKVDDTLTAAPDTNPANESTRVQAMARRQVEASLARQGLTRNMRGEVIANLTPRDAGEGNGRTAARDAGDTATTELVAGIQRLIATFKGSP